MEKETTEVPAGMLRLLKHHGALMEQVNENAFRMTIHGRLFIVAFLMQQGCLGVADIAACAKGITSPEEIYLLTSRCLYFSAKKWMTLHAADGSSVTLYEPTDLTLDALRALLAMYLSAQEAWDAEIIKTA